METNTTSQPVSSQSSISESMIQVDKLSIAYGDKRVLEDVTLSINKGCITALIGPSGCGKTSFLGSLNRLTDLIPRCRVEGNIQIGAVNVHSPLVNVRSLRLKVGMIFQKPNPFPLSIRRNIELPLREQGIHNGSDRNNVMEQSLQDAGLWEEVKDRLDSPALSLSGGQQQRLCIARALALQPEVLLFDEPCSALDPIATEVIEQLIVGYSGRMTVVIVTHNLAQAQRISDYAAFFWMKNGIGRLIEYAPSHQLFNTPQDALTDAYVNGRLG
ncbi:Phosphate transport ATP-binding protein PstB (TC 3.A.1.7.1) [hydrothermal vent metagenome]|uniref:Phosphate transport ATP-binding protein PstB (TC 3.A.1.7.1) n=1 Tax=hydrothermal vent metagenome TaxID=652676 RepID=A0A3B1DKC6_9ZZZZ